MRRGSSLNCEYPAAHGCQSQRWEGRTRSPTSNSELETVVDRLRQVGKVACCQPAQANLVEWRGQCWMLPGLSMSLPGKEGGSKKVIEKADSVSILKPTGE